MDEESNKPIPKELEDEFVGFMAANNNDKLSDGAWLCVMEDSARKFMRIHKIEGYSSDAFHQWAELVGEEK